MLAYIATHLANHALGLISLDLAEQSLQWAAAFWRTVPATIVLYGAAFTHIGLAVWSLFERRTLRLPALELLRVALGLWLPVLLIGHAVTTRLEFEAVGEPATYARIVGNLWASGGRWWQLGLLAPGWIHGCLGLHFAFGRRPLWRRFRTGLFALALLLPVLSALGFVDMGRELARQHRVPATATVAVDSGPSANTMRTIGLWRQGLLWGYLGLVGLAFSARSGRSFWEHRSGGRIAITYPDRRISVPKGLTLLEASRAYHVPHASACGGRGRCSTCRVRVLAGGDHCPPPADDERRTLTRIHADPDVRLACQLRPRGDVDIAPLEKTERQTRRERHRPHDLEYERDVVLLYCDIVNRDALDHEHLPHDVLFVLRRFTKRACEAVSSRGGTVRFVADDGLCGLFGLAGSFARASRSAMAALAEIDRAIQELRLDVGGRWGVTPRIVVSAHAGRVTVRHLVEAEDAILIAGDALQAARSIRGAATAAAKTFALSDALFTASELEPPGGADVAVATADTAGGPIIYLMDRAPHQAPPRDGVAAIWRGVAGYGADVIKTMIKT
jgi:adenylate cyclase